MNNSSNNSDIVEPFGITDTELVMIISPSPVYQETLKDYLLDLEYRIVGPYNSVDMGHTFIRKTGNPDLIIFDAITTQSELISFSQLLREEEANLPVLIIHQEDSFALVHTNVNYINPPINPAELDIKIRKLLKKDSSSTGTRESIILEFTNKFFSELVRLSPPSSKTDITTIIRQVLMQFTLRNADFSIKEEESLSLKLANSENIDEVNYKINLLLIIDDLIEQINTSQEANWGEALIKDVLENIVIMMPDLPDILMEIVEEKGKDPDNIRKSLEIAIPDISSLDTTVLVAKLTLSDTGPELEHIVSHDPTMINEFDEVVASQIITLVGQGASYHQGIFGPIPIPKSNNIVAIIWSKLLKSNIKDERMGGKTLAVVVIGMKREIINLIPSRDKLEKIFSPLDNLEHTDDIIETILYQIEDRYEGYLK